MKYLLLVCALLTASFTRAQVNSFSSPHRYGFIENKGQIVDQCNQPNLDVKFLLHTPGLNVQLKANRWSYDTYVIRQGNPICNDNAMPMPGVQFLPEYELYKDYNRIDVILIGANPQPEMIAEEPAEDYLNYYTPATPEEGVTFVRHFRRVTYKNIYPSIDVTFFLKVDGSFEYDFIIHPGGNPNDIRLDYKGQQQLELTPEGKFFVETTHRKFEEQIPASYLKELNQPVAVAWCADKDYLGFEVGLYDVTQTLMIDPAPVFVWGTYYGGTNDDDFKIIATNENEDLYAVGYTQSTNNIATSGAYIQTLPATGEIKSMVVKFTSEGVRIWGTYIGGSSTQSDGMNDIKVDQAGDIVAVGNTYSSGLATSGAYKTVNDFQDVYLIKFNPLGLRLWATYYGGTSGDVSLGLSIDSNNDYIVGGHTASPNGIASVGAYKTIFNGGSHDSYVAKFSATGVFKWGTYFGGGGTDYGNAMAVDAQNNILLSGNTGSTGLATAGTFQTAMGGGGGSNPDSYLAKISSDGASLVWCTYIGGSGSVDDPQGILATPDAIFVTGQTDSPNNISTTGSQQPTIGGGIDAYILKFNNSGQRIWGTYYGGSNKDIFRSVASTSLNEIYFAGWTASTGLASLDAHQLSFSGGTYDGLLTSFDQDGNLLYSTYLGGTLNDVLYGVHFKNSNLYFTGFSYSTTNIASSGSHQTTPTGGGDAILVKFNICNGLSQPITQPTGLNFPNRSSNSLSLAYTGNNSQGYLIIRKVGSYPTAIPLDGVQYTSGQVLGDGVVTSTVDTQLTPGTEYFYRIYAYNCNNNLLDYNTTSPLQGSAFTLAAVPTQQPSAFSITNLAATSFTVNFTAASGSPSYIALRKSGSYPTTTPTPGTAYTAGTVFGDAEVVYVGSGTSFNQTGLSVNTTYYYSIYSFNGSGVTTNYLTTSPLQGNQVLYELEPAAQPTALSFTSVTTSSFVLSFQAASPTPTGYLVLRRTGVAPTGVPSDGSTYSVNGALGDGTIVSLGTSVSFTQSGLSANTVYHYAIFAFNGSGVYINYKQSAPLIGSRSTLATEPTAQPTNLIFSNLAANSQTVSFNIASGSPQGYIVFRKTDSAPVATPTDGEIYTLNENVGDATVAYTGSASSFNDTGLAHTTNYYYAIFSYNGTGQAINYRTTSPLTGNRSTLAPAPTMQPVSIVFSNVQSNSLTVSFSAPVSPPDAYLGILRAGASPTGQPENGTSYATGNVLGNGTVVFVGSGTTFNLTSLSSNTEYYLAIYAFNGGSTTTNYLLTSPLLGNRSTLTSEPTSSPSNISFTNVTSSSFTVNFTAAAGSPSGYIAFRKENGAPATLPQDGIAYTVDTEVGDARVVFVGSGTSFTQTGLVPGTVYYYSIFAYNGSGNVINYRTTSPATGNQAMIATEPGSQPTSINFSNVTDISMTVAFTAAAGSPGGYIGLRKIGSSPTDVPVDGTTYSVGNTIGTSIVAFVGSGTSFSVIGLSASTTYFFDVFAYNGTTGTYNYLITTPLEGSQTTFASQPASQPTSINFSNVTDVGMTVSFTAAAGSPGGYIGLRKTGSSPTDVPVDGTAYAVGNTIGTSTVAFVGSGVSFSVTGLSTSTLYFFDIFAYNGTTGTYNYLTTSPLEGSQTTYASQPASQPTSIIFSAVTDVSMTVSFTAATGSPTGYLALRKAGSSPADVPVNGTAYSAGNTLGTSTIAYFGSAATFPSTGLSASTVYHYDIFSYNGSTGTYSYLITNPLEGSRTTLATEPSSQPTSLQFTTITSSSFAVSFTPPASAPGGYIAVRKIGSAPTSDPEDGNSYSVGNTLGDGTIAYVGSAATFNESGLNSLTQYFYKVYSFNGANATSNFRITTPLQGNVTTLESLLTITPESFPATFDKGSTLTVSITVSDIAKVTGVVLKYRGISEAPTAWKSIAVTNTGNKFERVVPAGDLTDAIGLKYYFEVTDLNQNVLSSTIGKSYVRYTSEQIPGLSFGNKVSNYSIIAIPFKSSSVSTVFSALGQYDPTQWRLFEYSGGDNREYPAFSSINPGKGYWLIVRNSTVINPGTNTAVEVDETTPFTISLSPGWNLIGNPYNFRISWTEVLAASGNPSGIAATLTQFSNGTLTANGTVMDRYRGAFIQNTTSSTLQLKIPVLRNISLGGGRIATNDADLEKEDWEIEISITDGDLTNAVGGIGMHPSATLVGADGFDKARIPLIDGMNMPEVIFAIPDTEEAFNKELVPTKENFTWQFEVLQFEGAPVKLNWSPVGEEGSKKLYLLDPVTQRVVDMKAENELSLSKNSKTIKVLFGSPDYIARALEQELPTMGQPYPNPARKEVTIPFYISEALDNAKVTIRIFNNVGSEVTILADDFYKAGRHLIKWEPEVKSGLYFISMKVGSGEEKWVKIVIQ